MVSITFEVDPELWARFRKTVKTDGLLIKTVVKDLIKKYLEANEKS